MKLYILMTLTLMSLGSIAAAAERTSKGRKTYILPSNSKLRQKDIEQLLKNQYDYEDENEEDSLDYMESAAVPQAAAALKPDSSSGRLFFKKFFQFGKQTSSPQIIVITQPSAASQVPYTSSSLSGTGPTNTFSVITEGNQTSTPVGRGGSSYNYDDDDDDDDDVFDDEIPDETPNTRKQQQPTLYKLVKGKGNQHQQQGLSIVVPSKYMRNLQNNRNTLVVNPSGAYNSGSNKMKKFRLSINSGGSNGKKKRSRSPSVHRRFVPQN